MPRNTQGCPLALILVLWGAAACAAPEPGEWEDAAAATQLSSAQPLEALEPPASGASRPEPTDTVPDGRALYMKAGCYGCHGTEGGGGMGPSLRGPLRYGADEASLFTSIAEGRPNGMPAYAEKLSEREIRQIVAYIQSLRRGPS